MHSFIKHSRLVTRFSFFENISLKNLYYCKFMVCIWLKYDYSKYKFKCLLTKDASETSSLEYNKNKLYSNLPLLYQHMFLCVNGLTHFNWVL